MQKLTKKLPDHPGVYIFRGPKRAILYIGKATSLRSRVASYFRGDLIATRGPIIVGMVEVAKSVDFVETDSVLEALILEAHLIKKHQPPYNTKEKSDKSFNYVVITDEEYPRVLTMRGREIESVLVTKDYKLKTTFGPFPQGSVLREALKIVRKIFPFRDKCLPATAYRSNGSVRRWQAGKVGQGKPCFNAQIGLCPGVCAGIISRAEYAKTIRRIKLFFEGLPATAYRSNGSVRRWQAGKKQALIRGLERDMKIAAKNLKFEEANRIKKIIFALNHIQDIALLKADFAREPRTDLNPLLRQGSEGQAEFPRSVLGGATRIEAYDVAHISGTNTVGVMVVVEDGEPKKSDYRKFKIKTSTNDDTASLREMLGRRFAHTEWPMPKLIVVDGGKAQVNTAEKALKEWGIGIPVVGVVKDEKHRPKEILIGTQRSKILRPALENLKLRAGLSIFGHAILLANSEAHRFAIGYHRILRGKIEKTKDRP